MTSSLSSLRQFHFSSRDVSPTKGGEKRKLVAESTGNANKTKEGIRNVQIYL